jgi:hypothetical protein
METKTFLPQPPADDKPAISKERRKQLIWTIWVPLIFAILLMLAAAVWVCLPESNTGVDTRSLGSLSFIWVSAPAIPILLVFAALAGAMIYLLAKFLGILPGFFHKVQFYFNFAANKTRQYADKIAAPVISIKGYQASASHLTKIPREKTEIKE